MADQLAKGEELERKAEKKLAGWGLFGSKYEDAAELLDRAANAFKLAKACEFLLSHPSIAPSRSSGFGNRSRCSQYLTSSSSHRSCPGMPTDPSDRPHLLDDGDKAGSVYTKLANIHLKLDSKHEAASAFVDAANCYKKVSSQEAAQCLNQAVDLLLEIGRLNMAAKHCKELGEIYETQLNCEMAVDYYERAADLYQSEESTTSANQCKQKVAELCAQLEQYPRAVEIYEAIGRHCLNNNLLKYSVKGYLLNAGLCLLCRGDVVAITNALERYQELDPTFSGTREYKFLADLAASVDEEDVAKFTAIVTEFDSMTRLDAWKTTLLLRAKNALKAKEEEEDDLT